MSENLEPGVAPVSHTPQQGRSGCRTVLIVFAVLGIGVILLAFMLPPVRRSREAARRSQCRNNLKQIALALHNYEAEFHALPPAYTTDANGKPLHSWRTLILPYLDQQVLYNTIDFSKPWDDPTNTDVSQTIVPIYCCPSNTCPRNHTTYLASVAPNGCLHPTRPRLFSEITDGTSTTLMLLEVPLEQSIPWMSPQDVEETLFLNIGPNSKTAHQGGSHAALCDGSIRFLSASMSAADRRALITIAGGEQLGDF